MICFGKIGHEDGLKFRLWWILAFRQTDGLLQFDNKQSFNVYLFFCSIAQKIISCHICCISTNVKLKRTKQFFPLSIWADYSFLKTIIILRIYSIFWIYRREASGVVRQTLLQTRRKRQFLAKFLQQEEKLRRIKYGQHKKYGQSIKHKQNIFRLIWFRFILPL